MTSTNQAKRPGRRRIGLTIAVSLAVIAGAYWYWQKPQGGLNDMQSALPAPAASPVSYPAPGKEPAIRTEFPPGVNTLSGAEIVAALSDHTAMLAGGFIEYYAPDGKLHGMVEAKHYGGSWEVRNGAFCTLLQDSSDSVCSPVGRAGDTLYWSEDGGKEASPVSTVPGNVRGLN
jgi:hypothetical protein